MLACQMSPGGQGGLGPFAHQLSPGSEVLEVQHPCGIRDTGCVAQPEPNLHPLPSPSRSHPVVGPKRSQAPGPGSFVSMGYVKKGISCYKLLF